MIPILIWGHCLQSLHFQRFCMDQRSAPITQPKSYTSPCMLLFKQITPTPRGHMMNQKHVLSPKIRCSPEHDLLSRHEVCVHTSSREAFNMASLTSCNTSTGHPCPAKPETQMTSLVKWLIWWKGQHDPRWPKLICNPHTPKSHFYRPASLCRYPEWGFRNTHTWTPLLLELQGLRSHQPLHLHISSCISDIASLGTLHRPLCFFCRCVIVCLEGGGRNGWGCRHWLCFPFSPGARVNARMGDKPV